MSTGRHVDPGRAKHARPVAVFVDGSGQRTRWVQWGFRLAILVGIAAMAVTIVSLLGGVALPGLTRPVTLPSGEPAHPRASAPPALADPTKATSSAPGARSTAGSSGGVAAATPRTAAAASAARATPAARPTTPVSSAAPSTGRRRTTPAPASSAAATTPAATPSASPTARPTAAPSHTRTVGATPTTHAGSTHGAPPTHPGGRPSSSTST